MSKIKVKVFNPIQWKRGDRYLTNNGTIITVSGRVGTDWDSIIGRDTKTYHTDCGWYFENGKYVGAETVTGYSRHLKSTSIESSTDCSVKKGFGSYDILSL